MKTIQISDETYSAIRDQLPEAEATDIAEPDDLVGQKLFIRTVTYHMTGRVVRRLGSFIELETAAWIADSGRFADALATGKLNEVEPVGQAWVNLNSVVDFFPWAHELPREQS